jgi:hypothetical protein
VFKDSETESLLVDRLRKVETKVYSVVELMVHFGITLAQRSGSCLHVWSIRKLVWGYFEGRVTEVSVALGSSMRAVSFHSIETRFRTMSRKLPESYPAATSEPLGGES